jgi:hypothetical protein
VEHHEVPFFVAVEGFARVLASAVVAHCRGRFTSGRASRPGGCCDFEIDHGLPSEAATLLSAPSEPSTLGDYQMRTSAT